MNRKYKKDHDRSTAELKELMTVAPMTGAHYVAIMRKRVASRRMIEDALEGARENALTNS